MARKPFAKADFDPSLVDNYEDGYTGDKGKKIERPQRYSFQRVIVALAICVRPRTTKELMWMAGIKYRPNAMRTIKSVGGIQLFKIGRDAYWGAPYMKDEPVPELVQKYDDWLFGHADWPEEFGSEYVDGSPDQPQTEEGENE